MAEPASRVEWEPPERREMTVGFVARAALAVLGVWALANMLWLGRDLLFVAFFAVLVALFLSILVDPLERLGVPRVLAAVLVLLVVLGALAGLFVLAWPTLQEQFRVISRELPAAVASVERWVRSQYLAVTGEVGRPNAELAQQLRTRLGSEALSLVTGALPLLNTVVGALFGLLVVLFGGLYLAAESRLYVRGIVKLVPPAGRERVQGALHAAGGDLRRWIFGTVINMVVIGVLTTVGLWLLGVPAALALGLIAGLLEFIPIIGPVLSAVPALAVALILSPQDALWVLLLYVGVQQVESNVLSPLVMKGAVELPPALTLFAVGLMGVLFGFLGLLLAVPILAVVLVLTRRLYVDRLEEAG